MKNNMDKMIINIIELIRLFFATSDVEVFTIDTKNEPTSHYTRWDRSGYSIVVMLLISNQIMGVRFSPPAPQSKM